MKLTKFTAGGNLPARWGRKGFTLVEIMIVVLIIGILLAIAVPNFIKARETSRSKSCVANLKQVEAAKEQWCMDNKQSTTATPADTDLSGNTLYGPSVDRRKRSISNARSDGEDCQWS